MGGAQHEVVLLLLRAARPPVPSLTLGMTRRGERDGTVPQLST